MGARTPRQAGLQPRVRPACDDNRRPGVAKPTLFGSQRFTIKFRCGIQRWPAECADLQNLMKNGSGDEATAEGSGGS